MPYDERAPGPRGYSGRGNGGGRGVRPRQHERRGGGRGGGAGNGRGNHPGMINRPPVILARDKQKEPPSMAPGAVSIMQRETSGSHIPTSTTGLPMRSVTSPALLPTPVESGTHQPPSSLPQVLIMYKRKVYKYHINEHYSHLISTTFIEFSP